MLISQGKVEQITTKYNALKLLLNERSRRLWAATEAAAMGYRGISAVCRATGLSQNTIRVGLRELIAAPESALSPKQIRRSGGGRSRANELNPSLMTDLDSLVEPTSRGEPECSLRWTCKSVNHLAEALQSLGHQVCAMTVYNLLREMGYSLQSNRKTEEGNQHPNRNQQFEYIDRQVKGFQKQHRPVISIDTKKKENIGNFKNAGQEWHPKGEPTLVQTHDFPDPTLGKAVPYGVYDLTRNQGWVSVGIDHDTAEFAVESIRRWWKELGKAHYSRCKHLLITAERERE